MGNRTRGNFRIGIIQAKVSFSIEEGESQILKFINEAKKNNVDTLGLPEDCVCGLLENHKNYDPLDFLSKVAKEYKINLFGSNTTFEGDSCYGTGFYIDDEGKLISKVHKILLTKPEKEAGFSAGNQIQIFKTEFGKAAILICRDAFSRYSPTWFYNLKKRGVEYILVPSMSIKFDDKSINFWLSSMWLLARWLDIYIFAPSTIGKNYTPYESFGNALIVERDRGFLKQGSEDKEELLTADIPLRSEEKIKEDFKLKWDPVEAPEVEIVEKE